MDPVRFASRHPWAMIALALAAAAAAMFALSRPADNRLKVELGEAVNVPGGALVQAAGVRVGEVHDIRVVDGRAVAELRIDDEVWPLPRGTRVKVTPASVAGNVNRRLELQIGPAGAEPLADGDVIGAVPDAPIEIDDVLQTFGPRTRKDLGGALRNVGDALEGRGARDLRDGLEPLAGTVENFGGLVGDLRAVEAQTSSLLRDGQAVTQVLADRREGVDQSVQLASATMRAFGERTASVQRTLQAVPPALKQVQSTAARLQPSLDDAGEVLATLGPGAAQLVPLARVATPTLSRLENVSKRASALARTAIPAAPEIRRMLAAGGPYLKEVASVIDQAGPIAHCLRPYAPELAGTLSNWADWNSAFDATSHVARITAFAGAHSVFDFPPTPATEFKNFGIGYALLRPPGYVGGKPQFMPECGLTLDGLDPLNDWDDR